VSIFIAYNVLGLAAVLIIEKRQPVTSAQYCYLLKLRKKSQIEKRRAGAKAK